MCYKSRGPTVISYWSKNESCVLYRWYPGQLRSFKRPGYLEVRREKSRFFLATNLGWRSANATTGLIGVNGALDTRLPCSPIPKTPAFVRGNDLHGCRHLWLIHSFNLLG